MPSLLIRSQFSRSPICVLRTETIGVFGAWKWLFYLVGVGIQRVHAIIGIRVARKETELRLPLLAIAIFVLD